MREEYLELVKAKMAISQSTGFEIKREDLTPSLYPHVKDSVLWAVKGGRRAIFSAFGLQKTVTQLEILKQIIKNKGGKGLVICPKRVVGEFLEQAEKHLDLSITYVRNMQEVEQCETDIMITNYERVRDGKEGVKIEPSYFIATTLDEASVLRGYGTKMYQDFLYSFADVPYRFVATATPSPNRYKELIHYAGYLGIMDTGQALTRFFKRDSTKANNLTIHPHKEAEFWLWMSTWALFITKPSDLGHSDKDYELPPLEVHEEVVNVNHDTAGADKNGQAKIFRESALSLQDASREKRETLADKIEKVLEIINRPENINDHFIFWHDQEAERMALTKAVKGSKAVYGSQNEEEADQIIDDFKHGKLKYLSAKPEMLGEGINFQYHCHKAIMFIDYRFNDKFQAIHRIYRFMQKNKVEIFFVYAESESEVFKAFMKKWEQHKNLVANMTKIVRENGLANTDASEKMMRWMFAKREETKSQTYTLINNDCVLEAQNMADNSVDLIVTSIPFSDHYEYTPTYNDFGHNNGNPKFFEQMDYLTPELLRVLDAGRIACIHVKDRVRFGNVTGLGFPTIDRFSDMTADHFEKHGFHFIGRITINTDVVRENNQTYRLGYGEMVKDGSKMGVGCPEYLLLFRKQPTSLENAYADTPVIKDRAEYSLARWQIDAGAFWRSSGDILLSREEIKQFTADRIRKAFKNYESNIIYDYHKHVEFAEFLEEFDKLPKTFALVEPSSNGFDTWDDITRMRTLNARQHLKKRANHICPLQLDIIERCIERYSNKGDLVFDPFGGIGSTGYCAIKQGRKAILTELNFDYYNDAHFYLQEAEIEATQPTLFDFIE